MAKNGITGDGVKEAVGRIKSKFKQTGTVVIVLTINDIKRIINYENILRILKEQYESIKFVRI